MPSVLAASAMLTALASGDLRNMRFPLCFETLYLVFFLDGAAVYNTWRRNKARTLLIVRYKLRLEPLSSQSP